MTATANSHNGFIAGHRGRGVRAFSLVEVVISISILSVIMGAFAVALRGSSESIMTGFARGVTASQLGQAVYRLQEDLQETSASAVFCTSSGLPEGQHALMFPTARNAAGSFVVSSSGRPVWQGVIVYCPFVTSSGISQVRRYVYYPGSEDIFPVTFAVDPITDTDIRIQPSGGPVVVISRADGNTSMPAGQEYTVFCSALTSFDASTGALVSVTIGNECNARGQTVVTGEETAYVAPRN